MSNSTYFKFINIYSYYYYYIYYLEQLFSKSSTKVGISKVFRLSNNVFKKINIDTRASETPGFQAIDSFLESK